MGVVTLAAISWATDPHGLDYARTMGFTLFGLCHIVFAICTKDEQRSIFSRDTFADRPLLISVGLAIATTILVTTFGPFQRMLDTTQLKTEHWLICIGGALVLGAVYELRKALYRHPLDESRADLDAVEPAPSLATAA
jgi:magnesium-transporting ATPase (P-type)